MKSIHNLTDETVIIEVDSEGYGQRAAFSFSPRSITPVWNEKILENEELKQRVADHELEILEP